jgi:esterase/lipase
VTAGRALKVAGISLGGILRGIVASVLAVVAVFALVAWLATDSPTEQARKEVSALMATGHVDRCTQEREDSQACVYRTTISTAVCSRSFLFAVSKREAYGATPYRKPTYIFDRPCSFPSDGPL